MPTKTKKTSLRNGKQAAARVKKNQPHSGGFLILPLAAAAEAALPIAGFLSTLIGGGAAVANAYNANKNKRKELEELERHNRAMESKKGSGLKKKKK